MGTLQATGDFSRSWLPAAGMALVLIGCVTGLTSVAQHDAAPAAEGEYTLPALPYAYDALEPVVPEAILRVHHQKHHAGYVAGLNKTLKALEEARKRGDYSDIQRLSRDLAFHGSGHVLHSLYWRSMTPKGAALPEGALRKALVRDFGSFEAFRLHFAAATKAVEGSGWGLLAYEPRGGRLMILQVENHQNLTVYGVVPLLVCDVWEHAYYLKYKNRRADYVDGFFGIIDWPAVEARYRSAR